MQFTPEQLQEKIKTASVELQSFMQAENAEISEMQSIVQQRVRAAQKHMDNIEGRISVWKEMLAELQGPDPAGPQDTVTTMSSTKPAPAVDASPPAA